MKHFKEFTSNQENIDESRKMAKDFEKEPT